ncbi:lytic transglycosylase, partial [Burkholderia pseudomallei]|nr:lytic transglycosylase [Burkholderia pseudomallei]
MRRFSWLFVFLLGSAQYVSAQQMPAQSLPAQPASAPAAAAAASDASAPLAANQPNEENRRITSYLMKKFGVAREKAAKLADIVHATATKYALPPALVYA